MGQGHLRHEETGECEEDRKASAFLLLQGSVELVGVLGGFDPDQEGDGGPRVLVNGRVGDADNHHVVLPHPRARHGGWHDNVQQNVS